MVRSSHRRSEPCEDEAQLTDRAPGASPLTSPSCGLLHAPRGPSATRLLWLGCYLASTMLRERSRPKAAFIEPCQPSPGKRPPAGPGWIHEIKHDGFRIMARRDGAGVRLLTRKGNDFSRRFPLVAAALAALPVCSCLIDGEAIVTDQKGLAVFDLIRGHQPNAAAVLCAFDLLELDGEDLRREPIETRKSTLKSLLRGKHAGIAFNAHFIADGAIVYRQACALG
jgi:bifunctional non-homologous end joining protein LigD